MAITVKANEDNDLKYRQGLDIGRGSTNPSLYYPNEGINIITNPINEKGNNEEGQMQYFTE